MYDERRSILAKSNGIDATGAIQRGTVGYSLKSKRPLPSIVSDYCEDCEQTFDGSLALDLMDRTSSYMSRRSDNYRSSRTSQKAISSKGRVIYLNRQRPIVKGPNSASLSPIIASRNLYEQNSNLIESFFRVTKTALQTKTAKLVVFVLGVYMLLFGPSYFSNTLSGQSPQILSHPVVITVKPGDTVWSIASKLEPNSNIGPLVAEIESQTHSDSLYPGEKIVLK